MDELSAKHIGAGAAEVAGETRVGERRRRWLGIGVTVGAALMLSVMAYWFPHLPGDVAITQFIQAADFGPLARLLHALNVLGFPPVVGIMYGSILLALFAFGRRWEAVAGAFGVLGGAGINFVVKFLVNRPRPSIDLVHVEHSVASPGFPAGHVLNFTVFAGFLCCLAYLRMPASWLRVTVMGLLIGFIALMGIARVDSGEHWPSDVIGGYLLGALWLAVTVRFYQWGRLRWKRVRPIA